MFSADSIVVAASDACRSFPSREACVASAVAEACAMSFGSRPGRFLLNQLLGGVAEPQLFFSGQKGVCLPVVSGTCRCDADNSMDRRTVTKRWGFIDGTGRWIIPPTFEGVSAFSEGLASARSGGLWGFIRPDGSWAIPPTFSEAGRFGGGLAPVGVTRNVLGGRTCCFGYIDKNGDIYTGSVHADTDLNDALCPWCIADGSAHRRFGAEFVDLFDGNVPKAMEEEVRFRTPSYTPWQQICWHVCCGEPAEYWGMADKLSIRPEWAGAIPSIRAQIKPADDRELEAYLGSLSTDRGPSAYVFRCKTCRQLYAHTDFD
jgi:uncharacterized protein